MKMSKLLLSIIALSSLTACGLKGDLKRPEPMFRKDPAPVEAPQQPQVDPAPVVKQEVPDDELLGGPTN